MRFASLLFCLIPIISFSTEAEELAVYDFYIFHENNEPKSGFVVLSDMFPYDDFKEQNIIALENLGEFEYTGDNYHYLKGVYRERFLKALKIKESDSLFINVLNTNSISTFLVKDLKLSAFLTPYGPNSPIENWDYLIGFEIDSADMPIPIAEIYRATVFACIEHTNPFNPGKAQTMVWKKIDKSEFKFVLKEELKPKYMLNHEAGKAYKYQNKKYIFYIQNLIANERVVGRYLVVLDLKTNKEIRNILYTESEGASPSPLNSPTSEYPPKQFTGAVFKNKPPIIYGFLDISFGCPSISFVDKNEPSILLKCDNRH